MHKIIHHFTKRVNKCNSVPILSSISSIPLVHSHYDPSPSNEVASEPIHPHHAATVHMSNTLSEAHGTLVWLIPALVGSLGSTIEDGGACVSICSFFTSLRDVLCKMEVFEVNYTGNFMGTAGMEGRRRKRLILL